jgi:hypothetical protein
MMTLFDFFHVSKFSKINGKFPMDAPPITTTLDLTLVLLAQQKNTEYLRLHNSHQKSTKAAFTTQHK